MDQVHIERELGLDQREPTTLYCDNTGAIAFAEDDGGHSKMRHIDLRKHFIREHVAEGHIAPTQTSSHDNIT